MSALGRKATVAWTANQVFLMSPSGSTAAEFRCFKRPAAMHSIAALESVSVDPAADGQKQPLPDFAWPPLSRQIVTQINLCWSAR